MTRTMGVNDKALEINLDPAKYGTFAEIGAGQEVARFFFRAGGASGTVAKTISAYDMTVSDALYGHTDRYVSRSRLEAMLDREFGLLLQQLDGKGGDTTTFFVFADTMATRSYTRHDEGRGWMGVRFQAEPRGEPSEILIHVRMLDAEGVREQECIGIVGVNLIHGAFFHRDDPAALLEALVDDLTRERVRIDMIKFSGPCFRSVDNRLMSLQLVEKDLTSVAMFTTDGEVVHPGEVLYKRPVLIQRGSFRPVTHPIKDMLEKAQAQFQEDPRLGGLDPVVIMEMTLRNLASAEGLDHADFLARVDLLGALGRIVLISNYSYHYSVVDQVMRYTKGPFGLVAGIPALRKIFDETYYTDLDGGILEGTGRLFKRDVKLLVYPFRPAAEGEVIRASSLEVAPHLSNLYRHLLSNGYIEDIRDFDPAHLHVLPGQVLEKIRGGDESWETMVPPMVARMVKERGYFGFKGSRPPASIPSGAGAAGT